MFSFLSMKGFLGTGATFGADLNLVVQFIMGAALVAGAALAKKKALHSSRYLSNHGADFELDHDRTGDVALIPLTNSAGISESFSQTLLHRGRDSRTPGCGGATSGALHHPGGGYEHSSALATLYALETVDARGTDALVDCPARWHGNVLRVVYRPHAVMLSASNSGTLAAALVEPQTKAEDKKRRRACWK
jgi:hypothetical protein